MSTCSKDRESKGKRKQATTQTASFPKPNSKAHCQKRAQVNHETPAVRLLKVDPRDAARSSLALTSRLRALLDAALSCKNIKFLRFYMWNIMDLKLEGGWVVGTHTLAWFTE